MLNQSEELKKTPTYFSVIFCSHAKKKQVPSHQSILRTMKIIGFVLGALIFAYIIYLALHVSVTI